MDFQGAWAYNVYELVFEHGKMIRKINHSKVGEEIRKRLAEDPDFLDMREGLLRFIDEKFSSNKDVKSWWI